MIVTGDQQPVEFFLTPGSMSDASGLQYFDFDLPPGSRIMGDKAYNNYEIEDIVADVEVKLKPIRKANSERQYDPCEAYVVSYHRQSVETAASSIKRLMPSSIHAVTEQGFKLKVVLFILASSIKML